MIIPEGVNFLTFYNAAKAQGVKITSRYQGVSFNLNGGSPSWMVRYQKEGKWKFIGRFPFTTEGEKQAGDAYLKHLEKSGDSLRYNEKRKYKTKKIKE